MSSGVYRIVNRINGKSYVGSAVNIRQRWRIHLSALRSGKGSRKLLNAYRKYGEDSFELHPVELCDASQLICREQYWIDKLDTVRKGYNTRPEAASQLGFRHSEETRKKIGEVQKGKINRGWFRSTDDRRPAPEPGRKRKRQKPLSEEAKQKFRENAVVARSRKKPNHSEETKLKISMALKARNAKLRGE